MFLAPIAALAATLSAAGAASRPSGYTAEVELVLSEMIAAYSQADSYRDTGRLTILQQTGRVRQITKMPSETALQRGEKSRVRVLGGMQSITSDGAQLQIVLDALKQYQQVAAPSELSMQDLQMGSPGAGLDEGYPEVLEFLLGEQVLRRWTSQMRKISLAQSTEIAESACLTVSYETLHGAKINLFIDAQSHLMVRCDIDNTGAQQSPNTPPDASDQPTLQVVLQLDPVEVNTSIDDKVFALEIPQGMRRVDVFEAKAPGGDLQEAPTASDLIGQAAPPVPGQDFAGRAALLFFWSPDAGPGNLAAIQMVERLRGGAEGRGVAFLSLVAAGADPKVAGDLLAAKKASYPSTSDPSGDIARRYQIDSLPAFILIGEDGKIQHATSGDPIAAEPELAQRLQALPTRKSITR